jgi:hypothetical protein
VASFVHTPLTQIDVMLYQSWVHGSDEFGIRPAVNPSAGPIGGRAAVKSVCLQHHSLKHTQAYAICRSIGWLTVDSWQCLSD